MIARAVPPTSNLAMSGKPQLGSKLTSLDRKSDVSTSPVEKNVVSRCRVALQAPSWVGWHSK